MGDGDLHREVEALLDHHTESPGLLGSSARDGDLPELIGNFGILAIAGEGGMGVVYRAMKQGEAEAVALKVLRPGVLAPEWLARFRREAEVLQRFDHPHIARFFEAGSFDTPIGPQPYYAMEFVEGLKLGEWAAQTNPMEAQRLELLADLCDAVHYTHEQGVIHRDLKPGNILVTPEGRPKLIDFGIAARHGPQTSATTFATGTQVMLGTIPYMSPEQAQNAPGGVDARSDIYSLGVMAYELLAGRLPYDSASPSVGRALHAILNTEPIPLGRIATTLRGNVETILHRALEKNPAHRYQTANDMAADIRRHLDGRRIRLTPGDWRRRAARGLRVRPRLRVALAIVTAIGVVAGVASLTTALRKSNDASVQREAWNRFYTLVEDADRCRHYGSATPDKWRECIALFQRARADLDRLPRRPYTGDIERYLFFRLGELHYFLGEHDHDPDRLDEARAYFDQWNAIAWNPGPAAAIDSSFTVRSAILVMGHHSAHGGTGLTLAKLATYRDRVENLRRAITQQHLVRGSMSTGDANYQPGQVPPQERAAGLAVSYLNSGFALIRLGAAMDNVALVDSGMADLRRSKTSTAMPTEAHIGGFYDQLAWGEAHLARAELAGDPLDPAFAAFESAHRVTTSGEFRSSWRLACSRAQAWMLAARRAAAMNARVRALESAIADLTASMQGLRPKEDDFEIAVSHAMAAGAHAELGAAKRRPAELARADSLLDLASPVLTAQRFPIQCAELELQRARLARCRYEIDRRAQDLSVAHEALQRAGNLVPPAQYPRLQRLVQEEEARLASAAALSAR